MSVIDATNPFSKLESAALAAIIRKLKNPPNGGRPLSEFMTQAELGKFVKANGVEALAAEKQALYYQEVISVPKQVSGVASPISKAAITPKPVDDTGLETQVLLHGGMKKPHLHYDGKIYPLNAGQWNQITSKALEKFGNSIAQAKNISFDNFMKIAEIVEEIT